MRFVRGVVLALAALTCGLSLCMGQAPDAAQPVPQSAAQTAPAQPASTDAYTLTPEKLAQAKALNRIRLTLEIVGTFWGLAVLWILLARRWATGLETWAGSIVRFRWVQGLIFFSIFTVITTIAGLPSIRRAR